MVIFAAIISGDVGIYAKVCFGQLIDLTYSVVLLLFHQNRGTDMTCHENMWLLCLGPDYFQLFAILWLSYIIPYNQNTFLM